MPIQRRVIGCFTDHMSIIADEYPAVYWAFHLGWEHLEGIFVAIPLPVLLITNEQQQLSLNAYGRQADRLAIAAAEHLDPTGSLRDLMGNKAQAIVVTEEMAAALLEHLPTWSRTAAILQLGNSRNRSPITLPYRCPKGHRLPAAAMVTALDALPEPPEHTGIALAYNCDSCSQPYQVLFQAPVPLHEYGAE